MSRKIFSDFRQEPRAISLTFRYPRYAWVMATAAAWISAFYLRADSGLGNGGERCYLFAVVTLTAIPSFPIAMVIVAALYLAGMRFSSGNEVRILLSYINLALVPFFWLAVEKRLFRKYRARSDGADANLMVGATQASGPKSVDDNADT